jgi:hypothetical protein
MSARFARAAGAADPCITHGRLRDVDPESQQFPMNPRCAPTRVRLCHRSNQRADIRRHGRSPRPVAALPRPPQSEAPSVPGDDGLWLDDDEHRSPFGPHAREHDPEPTVHHGQPQPPRPRALQHLQLVAQRQDFELERCARMRPCSQGQEDG